MDEAEKYQQRLQAIAEKRRLQEEQERARREMEDEKLRLQQLKRKSLRDQWLMEGPPSTPDSPGPSSPLWGSQAREIEERIDKLQTESQQLAEEEEKLKLEGDVQAQNNTDGDEADITETDKAEKAEDVTEGGGSPEEAVLTPSLQGDPLENGAQGRSVLEVVEVQVEKDLKTGATTIKSVSPLAPGEAALSGETVFDDGRRSVQTVGGLGDGAQPTPEELGMVLSAVAGGGPQAVTSNGTVEDGEEAAELVSPAEENGCSEDTSADSTHNPSQEEGLTSTNGPLSDSQSPQPGEGSVEGGGSKDPLGEGPVTMTFLGFSEAEPGQHLGDEDAGEIIRAERVIITEEGDDLANPEQEAAPEDTSEPVAPPESSASAETPEGEVPEADPEAAAEGTADSEKASESEVPQAEAVTGEETGTETGEGVGQKAEQDVEQAPVPEEEPPAVSTETDVSAPQVPVYSAAQPSLTPQPEGEGDGADVEGKVEEETPAAAVPAGQFQDVPLDGNVKQEAGEPEQQPLKGTTETPAQPSEQEPLLSSSKAQTEDAAPSRGEGGDTPKRKTCQCCSVM